jgi:hypothetical protein
MEYLYHVMMLPQQYALYSKSNCHDKVVLRYYQLSFR